MKNKTTFWIIILIIAATIGILFVGFSNSSDKGNKKDVKYKKTKKVDAYIVEPSLLAEEITVSGNLLACETVDLKNEVSGRVVLINLPEGKPVKKGTLLVKLFDDDLEATLKKLETQLAIQQQIYKRQSELVKVNGISQNDYEQTGLQINSLKADIEVQKAQISKTEVRAPFDGVIGLRNISMGQMVPVSTLLATIRTSDRLKLDFFVPEKYSPKIKTGMKVSFAMSGNEKYFKATVMATEKGIDDATRNMKVRALVDKSSEELVPGGFVSVIVRLGENPNALLIPTQAIIPEEELKNVIVSRKGKAAFVEIKTGIRKSSLIEVTEGLHAGDTVVTSGLQFIKEGAPLSYSSIVK